MAGEIDYNRISKAIKQEKCILFLGSELPKLISPKALLKTQLSKEIVDNLNKKELKFGFDSNDEFFHFQKRGIHIEIRDTIENFILQNEDNYNFDLYNQIAEIPFNLIISTSPDLFLRNTFRDNKFKAQFSYFLFNKNNPPGQLLTYPLNAKPENPVPINEVTPKIEHPLLVNLFGNFEDSESLVLTHENFFHYLRSIIYKSSIPPDLIRSLQEAEYIIFLGLNFDKWYTQLFLRILTLFSEEGFNTALFTFTSNNKKRTKNYFETEFGIEINDEKKIEEFISELHEKFGENRRKADTKWTQDQNNLIAQIGLSLDNGETKRAIDILKDLTENSDLRSQAGQISGSFKRLQKSLVDGIIEREEQELETSKIEKRIRTLLEL